MRLERCLLVAPTLLLVACGGGAAELGYRLPDPPRVTYVRADTTTVRVSAMGQTLQIAMRGVADYGVAFARGEEGLGVTLTVDRLAATVEVPMASTMRATERDVEGALVFTLDRTGRATVDATPTVSSAASSMIQGIRTAHTFFPRLPGRAVAAGEQWVDTIAYEADDELGTRESTVLRYTVAGDTLVDGRPLLKITVAGTSDVSNAMEMGGMDVSQSSTVEVDGHVLWDQATGLMFEMVTGGTGRGTVQVPIAPAPLPIEVRTTQRTRLRS